MTRFEWAYHLGRKFDHPLYQRVHRMLKHLEHGGPLALLDVGGRRSNYTIGLQSAITISDIPRESETQHALDLGTNEAIQLQVRSRRSNIAAYVVDDMTQTAIPAQQFDAVVAVEVLEHVEDDAAFVRNVAKVLKPGGAFIMTTPNGDFIPRPYKDHVRHYTKDQLTKLLAHSFPHVQVEYAVNEGRLIQWGVYKPSMKAPLRSCLSIVALGLSYLGEQFGFGGSGPDGKRHLVAVAVAR